MFVCIYGYCEDILNWIAFFHEQYYPGIVGVEKYEFDNLIGKNTDIIENLCMVMLTQMIPLLTL